MGCYSPQGEFDLSATEDLAIPQGLDLSGAGAGARATLMSFLAHRQTQPQSFAWIGVTNPTKPELALIAEVFALDPLEIEDAGNISQRPKCDFKSHHPFVLLKTLSYNTESKEIRVGQTSIFVGHDFAITISFGQPGDLEPVQRRIAESESLRIQGPMAVLYGVLDNTIDSYIVVVDEINDDMREIDQTVFSMHPTIDVTKSMYELKRENITVRRAVFPLVTSAQRFVANTENGIPPEMHPLFADVGDHILRVHDTVDTIDNSLLTMLMASTALLDLKQNSDMRKISAWVAIAAVPTMTAGIYGMNFDNMPELHWEFGYPAILIFMAVACSLLYRGFKKNGWL